MHDPSRVRFRRLISGEVAVGVALADRTSAKSEVYPENLKARGSNSHGLVFCNARQPAELVGRVAVNDPEEGLLEFFRYRTARSLADDNVVHRPDGRDFGGGSREEHLVGDVE